MSSDFCYLAEAGFFLTTSYLSHWFRSEIGQDNWQTTGYRFQHHRLATVRLAAER
jgi:hypothetical protein